MQSPLGLGNIDSKEGFNDMEKVASPGLPDLSHAATSERDPFLGKGRPSKHQFKLFQSNAHPFKTIALDLWIPWKLFAFPIVEFASFIVSWSASCFLTLNLTQTQAFAAPPYGFSPLTIGFFNFAILAGAIIGLVTAGPLSDWISMKLTKRNNGIREPEMRLATMIPYFVLMLIGNFITAFGWQDGWSWKVKSSDQNVRIIADSIDVDHRHYWLGLHRNPGRIFTRYSFYLCSGLLQTGVRINLCEHHRQQESVGLWLLQIHYAVGH